MPRKSKNRGRVSRPRNYGTTVYTSYFVLNIEDGKVLYLKLRELNRPDQRPFRVLKVLTENCYQPGTNNKTSTLFGVNFNSPYDQTAKVGDIVSNSRPFLVGTIPRKLIVTNKSKLWHAYNTDPEDAIITFESVCMVKGGSDGRIISNCTIVMEIGPEVFKAGCPALLSTDDVVDSISSSLSVLDILEAGSSK